MRRIKEKRKKKKTIKINKNIHMYDYLNINGLKCSPKRQTG